MFRIRIQLGRWIRIREEKNDPQKTKNEEISWFEVLRTQLFPLSKILNSFATKIFKPFCHHKPGSGSGFAKKLGSWFAKKLGSGS